MPISIDKAIRDLQARVDGEFTLPFEGVDDCMDMKLGISALARVQQARKHYGTNIHSRLSGETGDWERRGLVKRC